MITNLKEEINPLMNLIKEVKCSPSLLVSNPLITIKEGEFTL